MVDDVKPSLAKRRGLGRSVLRLFTVPYFPVRSSRSSAMIPDARPLGTCENQDAGAEDGRN